MKNQGRMIILDQARKTIGSNLNEDIFNKARLKLERWMRKAYGSVDYSLIDGPHTLIAFYNETIRIPNGKTTFNRGN
jgi:hypothetical protein